ncbi:MAG: hypothetical protein A3K19_07155 [Lentisphaerae bacterium RIFOXYB12_FULL_65_16]|nr:MAG: hypothetical protein A3K18_07025 [Lentisphaerae bacterium RIFOXYA12_64_32]OGV93300.1 MAG: hypothetical protein A3K19_07155 [Lentisphaerae bacterium RIFOXYB12_FULL_65_16]
MDARFLAIGNNVPDECWHIQAHSHQHSEVLVFNAGQEVIETQGQRHIASPGDAFFFGPGVVHEEWAVRSRPLNSYYLSIAAAPGADWPLHLKDLHGRLRLLAGWMYAERDAYVAAANDSVNAFVAAFLAEYARLAAHEENALVDTVRQYVRENIAAALSLDVLAERAGMSKYHFVRRYKQITGRTPMADVRAIRANHARDLILTTSLPLKRVAVMAGLSDVITLSRVCRKYLGFPPGQLRHQHSGRG